MSWEDRVQGSVTLVSPDGEEFKAKWAGDSRSIQKKLGIFTYPKFDGAILQDLGLGGARYPLELSFDGDDNDLEATRFFKAFVARGSWRVEHPTKGSLALQPVSITENIEPVESGSITVFDTDWIQSIPPGAVVSAAQLAAFIRSQSGIVDDEALTQAAATVEQDTVGQINALKSTTETTLSIYDKTIAPLLDTTAELAAQAGAIRRGIADTLSTAPLDLSVLGAQIQAIVRLPAQIQGDLLQTLNPFNDFIKLVSDLPDEAADQEYLNTLAIKGLFLTAANNATALVSASSVIQTRSQALEAADLATLAFINMTNSLDGAQTQFETLRVDQQYFSQSGTFVVSAQLTASAIKYLLSAAFNLAIEKRFTLDRERAPIEITITEYGGLGVDDSNFDLFIASNQLKGDDILLLPAGREVVAFV